MISLKNPGQIAKMREAGKILREVEDEVREHIRPGVSTAELDILAEKLIRKNGAIPSSLHYEGYPCSICASINDEVVHGIPSERRILKDGDVVSIDCTLVKDGWQADSAFTAGVGPISEEAQKLIRVTEECFWEGIRQCIAGNRLGDVGHAIDAHARKKVYRPRNRQGNARRPIGIQLRRPRPGTPAQARHDDRGGADDCDGRLAPEH